MKGKNDCPQLHLQHCIVILFPYCAALLGIKRPSCHNFLILYLILWRENVKLEKSQEITQKLEESLNKKRLCVPDATFSFIPVLFIISRPFRCVLWPLGGLRLTVWEQTVLQCLHMSVYYLKQYRPAVKRRLTLTVEAFPLLLFAQYLSNTFYLKA